MIKAIVTDIEGTTTALTFVQEVLFPYARAHLADYVQQHSTSNEIKYILAEVSAELQRELTIDECITQLLIWSDEDKKITPLKALQGLIWEDGYRRGAFTGHIYPDVLPKLREWHAQGIALYVYSSGSVHAQKLLFGHTSEGDLTGLFDGFFDTRIGAKREAAAYARIAEQINVSPAEILFLSDIREELDAAQAVGYQTLWLCREGELSQNAAHQQVADFDAIKFLDRC